MSIPTPSPPPAPGSEPLLWDIFCRVIDNFGDLGVCWRLCADLAGRGHRVRLWVDDAQALIWMAPGALQGQWRGVQVLSWSQSMSPTTVTALPRADVWVEGFGCEIAPEFIAAYVMPTGARGQNSSKFPVWINLEYLSAESFVERAHALPSPVRQGPAAGQTKYFFYPGFTRKTGGILREPDLMEALTAFDASSARAAWLAQHGIPWQGETLISLFCYEPLMLCALLAQLVHAQHQGQPIRIIVASGRATHAVQAIEASQPGLSDLLAITYLPPVSQTDFDRLLWCCDLNFVRGEDSLARALWAGKPFVWQIYPQADGVHHHKLEAFLNALSAPEGMARFHRLWNTDIAIQGAASAMPDILQSLPEWGHVIRNMRAKLLEQDDLTTALARFVQKKR